MKLVDTDEDFYTYLVIHPIWDTVNTPIPQTTKPTDLKSDGVREGYPERVTPVVKGESRVGGLEDG